MQTGNIKYKTQKNYKQKYHKGFVLIDIILAISIFSFALISIYSLSASLDSAPFRAEQNINISKDFEDNLYDQSYVSNFYTNEILEKEYTYSNNVSKNVSDYTLSLFSGLGQDDGGASSMGEQESLGQNTCSPSKNSLDNISTFSINHNFGAGNYPTSIIARGSYFIVTSDGSSNSSPDVYVFRYKRDNSSPILLTSLSTGPGISDAVMARHMLYSAQASTQFQIQTLDIQSPNNMILLQNIKLNAPTATTSLPFSKSIFYRNGYVYLGTEKWNGSEFVIFRVNENGYIEEEVGGLEVGALVSKIFVDTSGDFAYISTAGGSHLRVVDVSDKSNPQIIQNLSFGGESTSEGKEIVGLGNIFAFGRTTGGFNIRSNPEFVLLEKNNNGILSSIIKKDVPGGVYGAVINKDQSSILLTGHEQNTIELRDREGNLVDKVALSDRVVGFDCYLDSIYLVMYSSPFIRVINFK